jgi:hypothetical protein
MIRVKLRPLTALDRSEFAWIYAEPDGQWVAF